MPSRDVGLRRRDTKGEGTDYWTLLQQHTDELRQEREREQTKRPRAAHLRDQRRLAARDVLREWGDTPLSRQWEQRLIDLLALQPIAELSREGQLSRFRDMAALLADGVREDELSRAEAEQYARRVCAAALPTSNPKIVVTYTEVTQIFADAGIIDVGESNKPGYTDEGREDRQTTADLQPGFMDDDATARLEAVATDFKIPADVAREALKQAAAHYAREITTRANEPPRPVPTAQPDEPAPHIETAAAETTKPKKPRPQWKDHKGKMQLPDFVTWAYAAEREAGTLSKATLRADKDLYPDYFTWRRRRHLPSEVHWLRDLPKGTEKRDQQLVEAGVNPAPASIDDFTPAEQEVIRRYEASKKRGYRARAGASKAPSYPNMSMD